MFFLTFSFLSYAKVDRSMSYGSKGYVFIQEFSFQKKKKIGSNQANEYVEFTYSQSQLVWNYDIVY